MYSGEASAGKHAVRTAVAITLMTLLLTACTCDGWSGVTQIETSGTAVFATVEDEWSGPAESVFRSDDGGRMWAPVPEVATDAAGQQCGSDGVCFRIDDVHIERSDDGASWSRVWSIPVDRSEFVHHGAARFFACPESGTTMRFSSDIVAVDRPSGTIGVVAMGDQGVVVVDDSEVLRMGIGSLEPTPFTSRFGGYGTEVRAVAVLALTVFWTLSLAAAMEAASWSEAARAAAPRWTVWVVAPFLVVVLAVSLAGEWRVIGLVLPVVAIAMPLASLPGWSAAHRAAGREVWRIIAVAAIGSGLWFLAVLTPFELWARDAFDSDEVATGIAAVVAIAGWAGLVVVTQRAIAGTLSTADGAAPV